MDNSNEKFDRCIWCEKFFFLHDMLFINKKYRHYSEILNGWICIDCWREVWNLSYYMFSKYKRPKVKKTDITPRMPTFYEQWRLKHTRAP